VRVPNDHGQCVSCGWCCTVRPCNYGEWDAAKGRCRFLTPESKCSKYEEIMEFEKGILYPMFGCGCSSTLFNDVRDAKMYNDSTKPSAAAAPASPGVSGDMC